MHWSFIFCHGDGGGSDYKFNQSLPFSRRGDKFKGPLVVFKKDGHGPDSTISDVNLADFRVVFRSLEMIRQDKDFPAAKSAAIIRFKKSIEKQFTPAEQITEISRGVFLRCLKDPSLSEAETKDIISFEVEKSHPIWQLGPTNVSKQMGIPLLTWAWFADDSTHDIPEENVAANRILDFLNLDIYPDSETWGIPRPRNNRVAALLVVRQDRRDINIQELKAFADFNEHMASFMKEGALGDSYSEREQFVQEWFIQEQFDDFLKADYPGITSPYSNLGDVRRARR